MYPREYFDAFWRGDLKNEVFVIMSFADEFTPVWEKAIRPAIEQDIPGNMVAHRVNATTLAGSIIIEIMEGIAHAKVVFADISVCRSGVWKGQRNGNAMYEVGLAHALRQSSELVMVRCDGESINFDLAGIKVQLYDRSDLPSARKIFTDLVQESIQQVDRTKALTVERALAALDQDCIKLMNKVGKDDYFHVETPKTVRGQMNLLYSGNKQAVVRLLSLGVLSCDYKHQTKQYAYHWTNVGKHLLKRMGIV